MKTTRTSITKISQSVQQWFGWSTVIGANEYLIDMTVVLEDSNDAPVNIVPDGSAVASGGGARIECSTRMMKMTFSSILMHLFNIRWI